MARRWDPRLRRGAGVAAGVGAVALAMRVLLGPAAAAATASPRRSVARGRRPWTRSGRHGTGSRSRGCACTRTSGDVPVAATLPAFPAIASGDVVEVEGRLRPPPDDDPYGDYLRRSGAAGTLDGRALTLERAAPFGLQTLRDASGDALQLALPEPEAGLAAGILVGLRERVDRSLAADFATAGVSHVVAISGWNIAIVAGLVGAVLRGRSRRLVTLGILGTVVAYVVAAGASPSVVRAAVMAGVALMARESGRAGRAPAALGMAAAILLLVEPAMIGDAGFRLSVMATAGLLAWANPLSGHLGRLGGGRLPGWLAEGLGISLAAQAATLPDVLATFGRLSLVSPVVNLAVVPLVPAAMLGGLVAMLAGGLGHARRAAGARDDRRAPRLARPAPDRADRPGRRRIPVRGRDPASRASPPPRRPSLGRRDPRRARGLAAHPEPPAERGAAGHAPASARSPPPTPRTTRTIGRAERLGLVAIAIVIAIAGAALGDAVHRETRLTVLDVGQGDSILLETRTGARMLVDGGPDPDRVLLALDERIPPWDRRLDVLVLTHPHEDHVAGLARILERYRVGRVFEPGMRGPGPGWAAWNAELHDGPPHGVLSTGARLRLGEVQLSVLWPDPGSVPLKPPDTGTGINNVSIVFLGEANGRRFLLMGDVEQGIDPTLLARGLPRVDVLKIAHHGSKTATTQAFVDAVRPRVAIASAGTGNPYGHPARSTLDRVRASGARVYRTDEDGSVEVDLRSDGLVVHETGPRVAKVAGDRRRTRQSPSCARSRSRPARRRPSPPRPYPPLWSRASRSVTAWASPTGYDPDHDHPRPSRGRQPAALARPVGEVRAARHGGRRHRRLPRLPCPCGRAADRPAAGRDRGAAPRRRQAGLGRGAGPPPPWRGLGGVARGERLSRSSPRRSGTTR